MLKLNDPAPRGKKSETVVRSFLDLADAVKPFEPGKLLRNAFITFTSQQARELLKACRYSGQARDLTAGGKDHIRVLVDIMKRGRWRAKDKIDFAHFNGAYILLNGHHRLSAQVEAGVEVEWTIVIHECSSEDEVSALYFTFDTNQRPRTRANIIAATGIAGLIGISATTADALFRAVPLIETDFDFSRAARDVVTDRVIDRRLERMKSFQKEVCAWERNTKDAPKLVKRRLSTQGSFAVALMTFRHQPNMAEQFWRGVAENDGLRKGDPRHTYLRVLNSEIGAKTATSEGPARAAATCWNAFYARRQITMCKLGDGDLRISGTPIGRR
jgi:hypothetical protein